MSPAAWHDRFEHGDLVDETPYGYDLARRSFTLEWSSDAHEGVLSRWWRMSVRRILGFDFVHVWRNRRVIQRADVVWTHTEREHLGVALLKALRPRTYRTLSVAQSVWLWDLWPGISRVRARFFRRLVRHHDVEVVLSRVNRDASRAFVPGRTVVRVPFGTSFATAADADAAAPTPARILVVGNDRHRDWTLMAEVSRLVPEVDFDIVSLAPDVAQVKWGSNVRFMSMSQREVLTTAYRDSTVVALPLRTNRHASGCTVAIEAISAGRRVVASHTGGIDEYLEGSEAILVPVGDAAGFADAVRTQIARAPRAGLSEVAGERGLRQQDYIARLGLITTALLAGQTIPDAVERFAPILDSDPHEKAIN